MAVVRGGEKFLLEIGGEGGGGRKARNEGVAFGMGNGKFIKSL